MIFISHHLEEIFRSATASACCATALCRRAVADSDIDRLVEMMVGRRLGYSFPPKPSGGRPLLLEVKDIQLVRSGPTAEVQCAQRRDLGFADLVQAGPGHDGRVAR